MKARSSSPAARPAPRHDNDDVIQAARRRVEGLLLDCWHWGPTPDVTELQLCEHRAAGGGPLDAAAQTRLAWASFRRAGYGGPTWLAPRATRPPQACERLAQPLRRATIVPSHVETAVWAACFGAMREGGAHGGHGAERSLVRQATAQFLPDSPYHRTPLATVVLHAPDGTPHAVNVAALPRCTAAGAPLAAPLRASDEATPTAAAQLPPAEREGVRVLGVDVSWMLIEAAAQKFVEAESIAGLHLDQRAAWEALFCTPRRGAAVPLAGEEELWAEQAAALAACVGNPATVTAPADLPPRPPGGDERRSVSLLTFVAPERAGHGAAVRPRPGRPGALQLGDGEAARRLICGLPYAVLGSTAAGDVRLFCPLAQTPPAWLAGPEGADAPAWRRWLGGGGGDLQRFADLEPLLAASPAVFDLPWDLVRRAGAALITAVPREGPARRAQQAATCAAVLTASGALATSLGHAELAAALATRPEVAVGDDDTVTLRWADGALPPLRLTGLRPRAPRPAAVADARIWLAHALDTAVPWPAWSHELCNVLLAHRPFAAVRRRAV